MHGDSSPHRMMRVRVADSVQVEVLDWGGRGEPLVFLAGLGNTAHVFDEFAPRFADGFRVIGITRRGFGGSDRPLRGYDTPTLAADVAAVLDSLGLARVTLVGHSIAGAELSAFALAHPAKVRRLVYLDSYDFGCRGRASTPPPALLRDEGLPPNRFVADPLNAPLSEEERASAQATRDTYLRRLGWTLPMGEILAQRGELLPGSRSSGLTDEGVFPAMLRQAERCFDTVSAPALGVFANYTEPRFEAFDREMRPVPLDSAQVAGLRAGLLGMLAWDRGRFTEQLSAARMELVPGAHHFVFLSHPDAAYRAVRAFLEEGR